MFNYLLTHSVTCSNTKYLSAFSIKHHAGGGNKTVTNKTGQFLLTFSCGRQKESHDNRVITSVKTTSIEAIRISNRELVLEMMVSGRNGLLEKVMLRLRLQV